MTCAELAEIKEALAKYRGYVERKLRPQMGPARDRLETLLVRHVDALIEAAEAASLRERALGLPEAVGMTVALTKRQREILVMLSDGHKWRESDIRAKHNTLCDLAHMDWLDGGFISNFGHRPSDRVWWITPPGRKALKDFDGQKAQARETS